MSAFKITGPGLYRTRGGQKAEVVGRYTLVDGVEHPWVGSVDGSLGVTWTDSGFWDVDGESRRDLIAPWTEPKKGTVWVNMYDDHFMTYTTRDYADRHAMSGRLACVSVNWTEGDGL